MSKWICWDNSTNVGYPCHDAGLSRDDGSEHCTRCDETISQPLPYLVEEYDPDGHGSPPDQLHSSRHATLADARAEIRHLLGVTALRSSRKWGGGDDAIEAYHMFPASHPRAYGCGGYAISRYDVREQRLAREAMEERREYERGDYDVYC
jgi:hypothetical protein